MPKVIKIPEKYYLTQRKMVVSPVEFYRVQLGFIIPHINNTMLTILAYVKHYGYTEAISALLKDRVLTSKGSIRNNLTELRREGLLLGVEPNVRINEDIILYDDDFVTLLILEKDETKNEVKHRYYKEGSI